MKKYFLSIFLIINSFSVFTFEVGAGGEYSLESKGVKTRLDIYISHSSFNSLGVEYYFYTGSSIFGRELWQQFHLKVNESKTIGIEKGLFYRPKMKNPEFMPGEYFTRHSGIKLEGFLFADRESLNKKKVGSEQIEVPAGTVYADHYREERNGQIIDFWINSSVKPIGLVKLISKNSKKASQNYTILLQSLLKNVKPKIDPKKTMPFSAEGKKFLP